MWRIKKNISHINFPFSNIFLPIYKNMAYESRYSRGNAKIPGSFVRGADPGQVPCGPGQYHFGNWAGQGCTLASVDRRRLGCGGHVVQGTPAPAGCGSSYRRSSGNTLGTGFEELPFAGGFNGRQSGGYNRSYGRQSGGYNRSYGRQLGGYGRRSGGYNGQQSFQSGLIPAEQFYNQAGGREGLLDRAINTAQIGSQQSFQRSFLPGNTSTFNRSQIQGLVGQQSQRGTQQPSSGRALPYYEPNEQSGGYNGSYGGYNGSYGGYNRSYGRQSGGYNGSYDGLQSTRSTGKSCGCKKNNYNGSNAYSPRGNYRR